MAAVVLIGSFYLLALAGVICFFRGAAEPIEPVK